MAVWHKCEIDMRSIPYWLQQSTMFPADLALLNNRMDHNSVPCIPESLPPSCLDLELLYALSRQTIIFLIVNLASQALLPQLSTRELCWILDLGLLHLR